MTEEDRTGADLANLVRGVVGELTKRVQDIDNNYRAEAEKMGQLYIVR
ncbi:MAG: hypothetical protein IPH26_18375 [Sterolibacteriaceae bacterium]|uniref:Uncharacterized protein n=1 Tax=Candidatus Methylophosphatis roskildensis TaxID=2899263 RepID=A0A9D7E8K5_9PROT|nr:hypothetical protein [Candidatus Methylophosphatis roskildensis]